MDPTPDSKEVLQGKIANIDLLFPEWDAAAIAAENWAEPLQADQQPQIQYPSELEVKDTTTIAKYYGLDTEQPVDPKAKGKKDNKKKEPETEAVEKIATEAGLPLPVVFKNSMHPTILTENPAETVIDKSVDEEFKDYKLLRPFCQYPSPEQLQVIEYQEKIKRRIARAQQAVKGTDEKPVTDPSPEAIKKLDELENLLEKTVKENSCRVNNGAEVDSFVCSAYKIIHKYAPLIFSTTEYAQLAADGRSMDYLWNSIYPKLASGKPYFNVAGKYCVKLYLGGKWRKIYVDDKIPLKADGMVAVASSSDKLELWPLIIAKAVYTVYSACG